MSARIPPPVATMLDAATPEAWIDAARHRVPELLLDHANCELKAASTAMGFLYRYPDRAAIACRMSRLAREELRHFEQVRALMQEMRVPFRRLSASRYAGRLRRAVRQEEPQHLLDLLLVGALIEARSCERFAALVPHFDDSLSRFYAGLLESEARHFEHYLGLARSETGVPEDVLEGRLAELRTLEARLITDPDPEFRFHSGPPSSPAPATAP